MIKEYIIKIDEDQDKKDIHGGYPLIEPRLELVRCKDCKFWHDSINCQLYSEGMATGRNWFCADGERR